jgi:hypothetical protein
MEVKSQKQIKYLLKITDNVGLIEHCKKDRPDYKEGWCVDDNARALQVGLRYGLSLGIMDRYFDFIKSAWREGRLYNDLNDDFSWQENFLINGEHCGRVLFALGESIKNGYKKDESKKLFDDIYELIKKNRKNFLRTISQIILALQYYKKTEINFWADKIVENYEKESNEKWKWFEDKISYDNGVPPEALLIAYQKTNNKKYLKIGLESLDFLTEQLFDKKKDYFSFSGNMGWFTKSGLRAEFDQQPIEVGSMVETYVLAYEITKNKKYKNLAIKAFEWFLGKNILGLNMINEKTGGIYDGIEKDGVNLNQGAESVLSYLIAAKEMEKIIIISKGLEV